MWTSPMIGDRENGESFNLKFWHGYIMLYGHIKEKESEMTIKSILSKTYSENLMK